MLNSGAEALASIIKQVRAAVGTDFGAIFQAENPSVSIDYLPAGDRFR